MTRWLSKSLVTVLIFAGASQVALAQTPGKVAAEESTWLVWVVFGGAALIILATGFMNPKRSHLN